MVSLPILHQAIDYASALEQLTEQHRAYASRAQEAFPDFLPSSEEIARELRATLTEVTDRKYAEAASLITAALEGDAHFDHLDILGYALVLATESKKGFTNEPAFQEVTRTLLAQNNYQPIRVRKVESRTYHFFVDHLEQKVVALSQEGAEIYTAELQSKYGLDRFVNDFANGRNGRSRELETYSLNLELQYPLGFTALFSILGAVIGAIASDESIGSSVVPFIGAGCGAAIGFVAGVASMVPLKDRAIRRKKIRLFT